MKYKKTRESERSVSNLIKVSFLTSQILIYKHVVIIGEQELLKILKVVLGQQRKDAEMHKENEIVSCKNICCLKASQILDCMAIHILIHIKKCSKGLFIFNFDCISHFI